jgi:hypothetical protein
VEIGWLVGDPGKEAGNGGMGRQGSGFGRQARQLGVAEVRMDSAVAYGMERDDQTAATAFRPGMMPFNPPAERTAAQPAAVRRLCTSGTGMLNGIDTAAV